MTEGITMDTPIPNDQMLLAFPLDPVCTLNNLVRTSGNGDAVQAVSALIDASSGSNPLTQAPALTLTGPEGVGKSHLLQGAVHALRQQHGKGAAIYLDLTSLERQLAGEGDLSSPASLFDGDEVEEEFADALPGLSAGEGHLTHFLSQYEGYHLAAIDDLDRLEAVPELQEAVLFLFNRLKSAGGQLLFAARRPPKEMARMRADLRSRILWGPVIPIEPPDDEALIAILGKMAADRQVGLSDALARFLINRLPRRVADFADALERLDREALKQQRPMTVPLAKEVLGL